MAAVLDLELVARFRAGDQDSLAELLRRYAPLIEKSAEGFFIRLGDREDLRQAARIGVWEAARDFRPYDGAEDDGWYDPARGFPAFVKLVVRRKVVEALVFDRRKKHRPMDYYSELALVADVPDPTAEAQWAVEELWGSLTGRLTPLERASLRAAVDGFDYEEIAGLTGVTAKTVDNALQRARKKVRVALHDEAA